MRPTLTSPTQIKDQDIQSYLRTLVRDIELALTQLNSVVSSPSGGSSSGGGGTDHGLLTGLADDDHTQYLNNARGDVRYSALGHGHDIASIAGLRAELDGLAVGNNVFVQSAAPSVGAGVPYLWIDTTGGNIQFKIEDGV